MNKFSVEDQYKIVSLCRNWVYKSKTNKEYAKGSLQKDKSHIKAELEKKELSWGHIKDVLLYIHMNLDPEKQAKIEALKHTIKTLEEKMERDKVLMGVERINMRDTIKRDYEKTFEDKYAVGQVADLEKQLSHFKVECMKLRTYRQEIDEAKEEKEREKYHNLACEKAQLQLEKGELEKKLINQKSTGKGSEDIKWKKKATQYKKLYVELLEKQMTDNIEMSISDIDSDSTDSS